MRNLISTCAVAFAIMCATQSIHAAEPAAAPAQPTGTESPAPAADATPAESATPAATAGPTAKAEPVEDVNSPEFQRAAKAYRQMEKDGQKLYCRNEKRLGTRLGAPVCLTEAQLWERIHKADDVRDDMRAPKAAPCGSSAAIC